MQACIAQPSLKKCNQCLKYEYLKLFLFKGERGKKRSQLTKKIHFFQGRSMLEYEFLKPLVIFLGIMMMAKKHWTNFNAWDVMHFMCAHVKTKMKEVLAESNYLDVTCDEVTTIDNQF
jgi:hypothetical protein